MIESSKILPKKERLSIKDCLLAVPEYKEILDGYEKQIYDLTQLLELSRSLCTTLELSKLIESVLLMVTVALRSDKPPLASVLVEDSYSLALCYLQQSCYAVRHLRLTECH